MANYGKNSDTEVIGNWLGTGTINMFGRPFAGKDTQGSRLAELFDAPMLSSGAIFRKSLTDEQREIMNSGLLVPSELFGEIILPYFSRTEFDDKPLILSSVGRLIGEEVVVMNATAEAGHPTKAVIHLDISEDIVRDRWEAAQSKQDRENRKDDDLNSLVTRLDEFNSKTIPVLNVYRELGLLIEVHTAAPKDEVNEQILDGLATFAQNS